MSKRVRYASVGLLATAGLLVVSLLVLWGALRHTPRFYQAALAVPVASQRQAGREFERLVVAWHNDVGTSGRKWSLQITDEQVNGWLAAEMPEKFPQTLPAAIQGPRVAFTAGQIRLACRYESGAWSGVVQLTLGVQLADEPDTVAIRLVRARVGLLPLPLDGLLEQLSDAARRADLPLRWAQIEGDPVALITLTEAHRTQADQTVSLEAIEVRPGELVFAGLTRPREKR